MKHTILLVDDEPNVIEGLSRSLAEEPYRLLGASSADEALRLLDKERVDIVVSDERMPGMSGSELLGIVRQRHPTTVRIILTGQASLDAAVRAINQGEIYRFLTKPCNQAELTVTLRQALEVKRLMEESHRLLGVARQQKRALRALEKAHPGITELNRTADGRILIHDSDLDPGALTAEIMRELEAWEERDADDLGT